MMKLAREGRPLSFLNFLSGGLLADVECIRTGQGEADVTIKTIIMPLLSCLFNKNNGLEPELGRITGACMGAG